MMSVSSERVNGRARPVTLAACPQQDAAARGPDEFRIAAGLASWSPAVLRASGLLREEETPPAGPGLAARRPQPQDGPGQPRTAAGEPGRRRDAMSAFRRNWWRLVFATVGAVAAVVSYGHIVNLFLSWRAPPLDARLMPVAIDGLIIIGAGAARSGQAWLGWSAIGPGLAASLYANVMNGLPHGYGPAMGSGWATVALFLATNVMERWKAAAAVTPREDRMADSGPGTPAPDSGQPGQLASGSAVPRADRAADKAPPRKPAPARTGRDRAADIIRRNPGWDNAQVAAQAGCDVRTVRRARSDLAGTGQE